ncbi:type VII secretion protein EccCa [Streptomyces roseicoloratus]|uniref:type VII secretion protein EccCa n=1 Tax=Streptomyces roseicoloratus TaxID=2508722 RepID=UPI0010098A8B|nr:type VII secretion protein EccCa [Streptomyces roseicoloratus]
MSTVLFRRPARRRGPDMPDGELSLQEPPTLPEAEPNSSAVWMYLPMGLTSLAMLMMFVRPGQVTAFSYFAIGMMLLSSVVMIVGQFLRSAGERKRKLKGERRDYLRYLAQTRRRIRSTVAEQQKALAWRHPGPAALWALVGTSRQWERRCSDEDFAEVRVARGDQKLGTRLAPLSTKPVEDLEPLSAHALRSFIRAYGTLPDQPIALYLRAWSKVLVQGDEERGRAMVRALVAQLTTFHAPEELTVALCLSDERRADWEWVKWLPHAQHAYQRDGAGAARTVAAGLVELEELLGADFTERPPFDPDTAPSREEPFTVIVVDGGAVPGGHRLSGPGYRNTVVVDLSGNFAWKPARGTLRLRLSDDGLHLVRTDRDRQEQSRLLGRPDTLGPLAARALAARLSPYRLGGGAVAAEPFASDTELTSLLGISDLRRHVPHTLFDRPLEGRERLRVPIAVGEDGLPVELDIKESAQGGMGPHGMLIGATGSGKSELLRTLVLGLALTHSSETLNFVLVDFKGGATFLGMDGLPHTSAVITNLADELPLVARMQDALHGELIRRQELLRRAGNYSSVLEYEKARAAGTPLAPLPSLFVVVDEFSELLAAHRDFMDLFVMIGRLGRSLGVHLLLASQRLEEGRMHQLESHLSYRIGLRTFSAMESRGVLGVPDAYHLPPTPGSGYLKSGVEALTRFRAAYVSGTYKVKRRSVQQARIARQVVPWSTAWVVPRALPAVPDPVTPEPDGDETLLGLALDRLQDSGPPAHQVWLPPLDTPPALDTLLPPLDVDPDLGLTTTGSPDRGRLRVPAGIVDKPFEQVRELLMVDFSGAGGHFAVAGGPQSGKSTVLRTLITGLALTHTPREVQFYCLDFGGGALLGLAGIPHVGGVAGRLDAEKISRTLAEVTALLDRREAFFQEEGIDSMATYRKRRAAGRYPDEPFGDVFLVVDGWSTVRSDMFDDLAVFSGLATRGLNYGVHLMVSTARWLDLSSALRDQIGNRLELRMGDSMDSAIDTRKAATVPVRPGRGLSPDKLHFLTALPRIDGCEDTEDLSEALAELAERIAAHWDAPPAPPVRMLPTRFGVRELPAAEAPLRLPMGVDEAALAPVVHDFAQSPHLLIVGDTESGKTSALRLIAEQIVAHHTPQEARILVVDYRRELIEAVPEEYRLGHAVAADPLRELLDGVTRAMAVRTPSEDISPARMRRADWWTGPRLFILVDDYEMVGSPFDGPFDPLIPHLPLGYEIGLHLVLARAATGASRQDPLTRKLQEVNAAGLLMSCPSSEGFVFDGVRPRILPPGRALRIARRKASLMQLALPTERETETDDTL